MLSRPIETPSTKNSTEATETLSDAVAVTGTTVPVIKLAPLAGDVIATVGGGLFATVIETAAEVV